MSFTIQLGAFSALHVHYAVNADVATAVAGPPTPVCRFEPGGMQVGHLHTFVTDWSKVTCRECVEWRHA